MRRGSFRVGRINFANGDMVGHTGEFAAAVLSVAATDLALGRVLDAAKETNTVVIVTADHGNADEMFELDKKTGQIQLGHDGRPRSKTSHTLAPVPFAIFNSEILGQAVVLRDDLKDAGLANIASTVLQLAGFVPPAEYEPSLIEGFGQPTAKNDAKKTDGINLKHDIEHPKLKNSGSSRILREQFRVALNSVHFLKIVSALRSPEGGCPWDREQSILTLRSYLIEEAYEAVQAASRYGATLNEADATAYADELGDVMLQVFLNAQISGEQGHFTVADVLKNISDKMIRRHPHVFAVNTEKLGTSDAVVKQWDVIKKAETTGGKSQSLLAKAQKKNHLPTLNYLAGISKSSWKVGFAWKTLDQTFADLTSEVAELKAELFSSSQSSARISDELGDVVFAMANLVVFLNQTLFADTDSIDFDMVARASAEKFLTRFHEMETILRERGEDVTEQFAMSLSLDTWDGLWREAKQRKYS
jgi:MazG family protein